MKYKDLKNQNKSYARQVESQNKIIKDQRLLVDKLTKEKIDLLSKLEIASIPKIKHTSMESFILYNLKKGN